MGAKSFVIVIEVDTASLGGNMPNDIRATKDTPLIGICSRPNEDGLQACIPTTYTRAVVRAGGIPVLLPFGFKLAALADEIINRIDGLLLTGGGDVCPDSFGGSPYAVGCSALIGGLSPERDVFEWAACLAAWRENLPTLGICRGLQVMNVSFGGTLVRDVQEQEGDDIMEHMMPAPFNVPWHKVSIDPASRLSKIVGTTELEVNSIHHEAIARPAERGRVVAWAPDRTPEAIEFPEKGFFVGVQWHPEMDDTEYSKNLIREFYRKL
jgi:putative glutamine amidotransferase